MSKDNSNVTRITRKVSLLLGSAVGLYTRGNFREAINVYLEIIKLNPNLPQVYLTLGLICEEVYSFQYSLFFIVLLLLLDR